MEKLDIKKYIYLFSLISLISLVNLAFSLDISTKADVKKDSSSATSSFQFIHADIK